MQTGPKSTPPLRRHFPLCPQMRLGDNFFLNERAQDYAYFIDREEETGELVTKVYSCGIIYAKSFAPAVV